jgi:plasmid stabilization system protein ParE
MERIVQYLEVEWTDEVTAVFVQKVFRILELLKNTPEMGSLEYAEKGIRGITVTKHNHLFYRATEKEIIVLNIFDNRSDSRRKKF